MVQLLCKLCLKSVPATEWKTHIAQKQHLQQLPCKLAVKGSFNNDKNDVVYQYFAKFGGIRGQNVTREDNKTVIEYRFWDGRIYSEIIHQEHMLFDQELEISWYKKVKAGPLVHVIQDEKMRNERFVYRQLAVIDSTKDLLSFPKQMYNFLDKLRTIKEEMDESRKLIHDDLISILSSNFVYNKLHFFGSSITDLDIHNSDVNIYLDNTDADLKTLELVRDLISASKNFSNVSLTSQVHFKHLKTQIDCELTIKNEIPVGNSELIKFYLTLDNKIRELILLVKFWADCSNLRKRESFSSYTIYILIIFYLQQKPYKLPSVADLQRDMPPDEIDGWNCSFGPVEFVNTALEKASLREVLLGFFKFYGDFDYLSSVISPYYGSVIDKTLFLKRDLPKCFETYMAQEKDFTVNSGLCVQDPFEHATNVSLSVPLASAGSFTAVCRTSFQLVLLGDEKDLLYNLFMNSCKDLFKFKIDKDWVTDDVFKKLTWKILTEVLLLDVEEMQFNDSDICYFCEGTFNIWDYRLPPDSLDQPDKEITVTSSQIDGKCWKMTVGLKFESGSALFQLKDPQNFDVLAHIGHFLYVTLKKFVGELKPSDGVKIESQEEENVQDDVIFLGSGVKDENTEILCIDDDSDSNEEQQVDKNVEIKDETSVINRDVEESSGVVATDANSIEIKSSESIKVETPVENNVTETQTLTDSATATETVKTAVESNVPATQTVTGSATSTEAVSAEDKTAPVAVSDKFGKDWQLPHKNQDKEKNLNRLKATILTQLKTAVKFGQQLKIVCDVWRNGTNKASYWHSVLHLRSVLSSLFSTTYHLFGSRAVLTASQYSAIDINVNVDNMEQLLEKVEILLKRNGAFVEVYVDRENEIVKCKLTPSDTHFKLYFNNRLFTGTTSLVQSYLRMSDKLQYIVVMVKFWLDCHFVAERDNFSTYAVSLLVIFYLQQQAHDKVPSVMDLQVGLPEMMIDGWNCSFSIPSLSDVKQTMTDLLRGFFFFYAYFDYINYVVAPYCGTAIEKIRFLKPYDLPDAYRNYIKRDKELSIDAGLCIQDVFDHGSNVTVAFSESCSGRFTSLCRSALSVISSSGLNSVSDLLLDCTNDSFAIGIQKCKRRKVNKILLKILKEVFSCEVTTTRPNEFCISYECIGKRDVWKNRINVLKTVWKRDLDEFENEIAASKYIFRKNSSIRWWKLLVVANFTKDNSLVNIHVAGAYVPDQFAHFICINLPKYLAGREGLEVKQRDSAVENGKDNKPTGCTSKENENLKVQRAEVVAGNSKKAVAVNALAYLNFHKAKETFHMKVLNGFNTRSKFETQVSLFESIQKSTRVLNFVMISDDLESLLRRRWPKCKIVFYGSRTIGTEFPYSDLNIFINPETKFNFETLRKVICQKFSNITTASNVIDCVHVRTKLWCRLNVTTKYTKETSHVFTTPLLKYYLSLDNKVRTLILMVKFWYQKYHMKNSSDSTFSSYHLSLMVVFYLQQAYKLPSVMDLQKDVAPEYVDGWNRSFKTVEFTSLALKMAKFYDVLAGFFKFYGNFDYIAYVIAPFFGSPVEKVCFLQPYDVPKGYEQYVDKNEVLSVTSGLCIQDPFKHSQNTSQGVAPNVAGIFAAMCRSASDIMISNGNVINRLMKNCQENWTLISVPRCHSRVTIEKVMLRVLREIFRAQVTAVPDPHSLTYTCEGKEDIWNNRMNALKRLKNSDLNELGKEIAATKIVSEHLAFWSMTVCLNFKQKTCCITGSGYLFHLLHFLHTRLEVFLSGSKQNTSGTFVAVDNTDGGEVVPMEVDQKVLCRPQQSSSNDEVVPMEVDGKVLRSGTTDDVENAFNIPMFEELVSIPTFEELLSKLVAAQNSIGTGSLNVISKDLESALCQKWPSSKVFFYGSRTTGTALEHSNLNIFIDLGINNLNSLVSAINGKFTQISVKSESVVCLHVETKLKCYINIVDKSQKFSTALIDYYLSLDEKVKLLLLMVKFFHRRYSPKRFALTSYNLALMVVFYLQQAPYNLPPVKDLQRNAPPDFVDGWNCGFEPVKFVSESLKNVTIRDLVTGFFKFYGDFDYFTYVITPYFGSALGKYCFLKPYDLPGCYKQCIERDECLYVRPGLCIQDPFIHSRNTSYLTPHKAGRLTTMFRSASRIMMSDRVENLTELQEQRILTEAEIHILKYDSLDDTDIQNVLLIVLHKIFNTCTTVTRDDRSVVYQCEGTLDIWSNRFNIWKQLRGSKLDELSKEIEITRILSKNAQLERWEVTVTVNHSQSSCKVEGRHMFLIAHYLHMKFETFLDSYKRAQNVPGGSVMKEADIVRVVDVGSSTGEVIEDDKGQVLANDIRDSEKSSTTISAEGDSVTKEAAIVGVVDVGSCTGDVIEDHKNQVLANDIRDSEKSSTTISAEDTFRHIVYKTKEGATLDEEIVIFRQAVREMRDKNCGVVLEDLKLALSSKWSEDKMTVFGSKAMKVDLLDSDLNVYIETADLRLLQDLICEKFGEVSVTETAVKCTHVSTKTPCVIETGSKSLLRSTDLVNEYLIMDEKIPNVVFMIKVWLHSHRRDFEDDFLSSYSIYLLVIFYLRQKPYSLPLQPTVQLYELFVGFLEFYGNFDYISYVTSPHSSSAISKLEFLKEHDPDLPLDCSLCIQDPIDRHVNLTQGKSLDCGGKLAALCRSTLSVVSSTRKEILATLLLTPGTISQAFEIPNHEMFDSILLKILKEVLGFQVLSERPYKCVGKVDVFADRLKVLTELTSSSLSSLDHEIEATRHILGESVTQTDWNYVFEFENDHVRVMGGPDVFHILHFVYVKVTEYLSHGTLQVKVEETKDETSQMEQKRVGLDLKLRTQKAHFTTQFTDSFSRILDYVKSSQMDHIVIYDDLCFELESDKITFYGSRTTGLAFVSSDLNIYADVECLRPVVEVLSRSKNFTDVELDGDVIKCIHSETKIVCRITNTNKSHVDFSELFKTYIKLDKQIYFLAFWIKTWLRFHNLSFSVYATQLLIVFFLQQLYKLPSVREIQEDEIPLHKSATIRSRSFLEIVKDFFDYYAKFDYISYVISPFLGRTIDKRDFGTSEPWMCIQDPFEHSGNVVASLHRDVPGKFAALCRGALIVRNKFLHRLLAKMLTFSRSNQYSPFLVIPKNEGVEEQEWRGRVKNVILKILEEVAAAVTTTESGYACIYVCKEQSFWNMTVELTFEQNPSRMILSIKSGGDLLFHKYHFLYTRLLKFLEDEKTPVLDAIKEGKNFNEQANILRNRIQVCQSEREKIFKMISKDLMGGVYTSLFSFHIHDLKSVTSLNSVRDLYIYVHNFEDGFKTIHQSISKSVKFEAVLLEQERRVKCRHVVTETSLILSTDHRQAKELINSYFERDEKFSILMAVIEFWICSYNLEDFFYNDAIYLMVMFYLQETSNATVFDLVRGFFQFYVNFDFFKCPIGAISEKPSNESYLYIEDPCTHKNAWGGFLEHIPQFILCARAALELLSQPGESSLHSLMVDCREGCFYIDVNEDESKESVRALSVRILKDVLYSKVEVKEEGATSRFECAGTRNILQNRPDIEKKLLLVGANELEKEVIITNNVINEYPFVKEWSLIINLTFEEETKRVRVTGDRTNDRMLEHYFCLKLAKLLTVGKSESFFPVNFEDTKQTVLKHIEDVPTFDEQVTSLQAKLKLDESHIGMVQNDLESIFSRKVYVVSCGTDLDVFIDGHEHEADLLSKSETFTGSCVHKKTGITCVLNFDKSAPKRCELIEYYLNMDDKVRLLMTLIKFWVRCYYFNDISNYAVYMLVIFYLQQEHYKLPPVVETQRQVNLPNVSLLDLVKGFFGFYANFDYVSLVISPYFGSAIEKIHFMKPYNLPECFQKFGAKGEELVFDCSLCIQDVFDHAVNIAAVSLHSSGRFTALCRSSLQASTLRSLLSHDQVDCNKICFKKTEGEDEREWSKCVKKRTLEVITKVLNCEVKAKDMKRNKFAYECKGNYEMWKNKEIRVRKFICELDGSSSMKITISNTDDPYFVLHTCHVLYLSLSKFMSEREVPKTSDQPYQVLKKDQVKKLKAAVIINTRQAPTFAEQVAIMRQELQLPLDKLQHNCTIITKDLSSCLKPIFPQLEVNFFGSVATKSFVQGSEVDIYTSNIKQPFKSDMSQLEQMKNLMYKFGKFCNVSVTPGTKMKIPIVKCVHKDSQMSCEVNIKDKLSMRSTELVDSYLNLDEKLRTFVFVVKLWVDWYDLKEEGSFYSYVLHLLAIFYLEQAPCKLKPVMELQKNRSADIVDGWNCAFSPLEVPDGLGDVTLLDLVKGFFKFYASFDFFSFVISPFFGSPMAKTRFLLPYSLPEQYRSYVTRCQILNVNTTICVQDPFEHSKNVASSIRLGDVGKFAALCRWSSQLMEQGEGELLHNLVTLSLDDPTYSEFVIDLEDEKKIDAIKKVTFETLSRVLNCQIAEVKLEEDQCVYYCGGYNNVLNNRTGVLKSLLPQFSSGCSEIEKEVAVTEQMCKRFTGSPFKLNVEVRYENSSCRVVFRLKGNMDVAPYCHFMYTRLRKFLSRKEIEKLNGKSSQSEVKEEPTMSPTTSAAKLNDKDSQSEAKEEPAVSPTTSATKLNEKSSQSEAKEEPTVSPTTSVAGTSVAASTPTKETDTATSINVTNLPYQYMVNKKTRQAILKNLKDNGKFDDQVNILKRHIISNTENKRNNIQKELEVLLTETFSFKEISFFGSVVTGLHSERSSVDVHIEDLKLRNEDKPATLDKLKDVIGQSKKFFEVQTHPGYDIVPTFHCRQRKTDWCCNLSISSKISVYTTQLISCYTNFDPKVRDLMFVIKFWADCHELKKMSSFSNYAIYLLVIFYLQQEPYSLPSVEALQLNICEIVDGWNVASAPIKVENHELKDATMFELAAGFFRFYRDFDYGSLVISPFFGQPIAKTRFLPPCELPPCFSELMRRHQDLAVTSGFCVQDPFVHTKNVTSFVNVMSSGRFTALCRGVVQFSINGEKDFMHKILVQCQNSSMVNLFCFEIEKKDEVSEKEWVQCVRMALQNILTKVLCCTIVNVQERASPPPVNNFVGFKPTDFHHVSYFCMGQGNFWDGRSQALKDALPHMGPRTTDLDKESVISWSFLIDPRRKCLYSLNVDLTFTRNPWMAKVSVGINKEQRFHIFHFFYMRVLRALELYRKPVNESSRIDVYSGAVREPYKILVKGSFSKEQANEVSRYFTALGKISSEEVIPGEKKCVIEYVFSTAKTYCRVIQQEHLLLNQKLKIIPLAPLITKIPNANFKDFRLDVIFSVAEHSAFNKQMETLEDKLQINKYELEMKRKAIGEHLKWALMPQFIDAKIDVFGFGFKDSSLSVCIHNVKSDLGTIETIKTLLLQSRNFILVSTTECRHVKTDTVLDLNIGSKIPMKSTDLIKYYLNFDRKLQKLMIMIKFWASCYDLIGKDVFSECSLCLLVVFYLQQDPYKLPSVIDLQKDATPDLVDGWNCAYDEFVDFTSPGLENATLLELVRGFFEFYANFDYISYVVSPFSGRAIEKTRFLVPYDSSEDYKEYVQHNQELITNSGICIQDLFLHSTNLTSSLPSHTAGYFASLCRSALQLIQKDENLLLYKLLLHCENESLVKFPAFTLVKPDNHTDTKWIQLVKSRTLQLLTDVLKCKISQVATFGASQSVSYACVGQYDVWENRISTTKKLEDNLSALSEIEKEIAISSHLVDDQTPNVSWSVMVQLAFSKNPCKVNVLFINKSGSCDIFHLSHFFYVMLVRFLTEVEAKKEGGSKPAETRTNVQLPEKPATSISSTQGPPPVTKDESNKTEVQDETTKESSSSTTSPSSRKRKRSKAVEDGEIVTDDDEDDDVPSDFFDDFANEDFLEGLDIVDAWDCDPKISEEKPKPKKRSRSRSRSSKRKRSRSRKRDRRSVSSKRHSRRSLSPAFKKRRRNEGYRPRRRSSSRNSKSRSRSRSRSGSRKLDESKKQTFLEEIYRKLNEVRTPVPPPAPSCNLSSYNSFGHLPEPPAVQFFSSTPQPVPVPTYDASFFIGTSFSGSFSAPSLPLPVLPPPPPPPKNEVLKKDDLAKLFAEKKISLSDFLTLTAKVEAPPKPSRGRVSKKLKVLSRCEEVITFLTEDRKLTGRLSLKPTTIPEQQYLSPLRRRPTVRFGFTTPFKASAESDPFARALNRIVQKVKLLKLFANDETDDLVDVVKRGVLNCDIVDKDSVTDVLKVSLWGTKPTKRRKVNVGSQCLDVGEGCSTATQVQEEDLRSALISARRRAASSGGRSVFERLSGAPRDPRKPY